MVKEALKRILVFLEEKDNNNIPFKWKLINNEPLTKEDLNVKGDLDLSGRNITSLPEGLKVGGNLFIDNTKITSLPEGLKVGDSLNLARTNITSLPEGFKVGGVLNLARTNITSLPKGLKVGGYMIINNTPLEKYTDDELREMIKPGFIKRKIYR
jgi:hypothetical protein